MYVFFLGGTFLFLGEPPRLFANSWGFIIGNRSLSGGINSRKEVFADLSLVFGSCGMNPCSRSFKAKYWSSSIKPLSRSFYILLSLSKPKLDVDGISSSAMNLPLEADSASVSASFTNTS